MFADLGLTKDELVYILEGGELTIGDDDVKITLRLEKFRRCVMSEKKMVAVNISHVPFNKLDCVIRAMMIGLVDTGIEVLKISSRTRPFFIETPSVTIKFIRNDPKYIKGIKWDAMFDFPEEIVKERVYPRPIFEGSLIEYVRKVEEGCDG